MSAQNVDEPCAAAEGLTDIPETLAAPSVPPIKGFHSVLSLPVPNRATAQETQLVDAKIDVPPVAAEEKADSAAEAAQQGCPAPAAPGATPTQPAPVETLPGDVSPSALKAYRDHGTVPPKGAFSLRCSTAVLSRSPSVKARAERREVEAAGWDAAHYPYDELDRSDLHGSELEEVIDALVRDIDSGAAAAAEEGESGVEEPAASRSLFPSGKNSGTATAPPGSELGAAIGRHIPTPTAQADNGTMDDAAGHNGKSCQRSSPSSSTADRSPERNGRRRQGSGSTGRPDADAHDDDTQPHEEEEVEELEEDPEGGSGTADPWRVLSPPKQSGEQYDVNAVAPGGAPNELTELRASSPDNADLGVPLRFRTRRGVRRAVKNCTSGAPPQASDVTVSSVRAAKSTNASRQASQSRARSGTPSRGLRNGATEASAPSGGAPAEEAGGAVEASGATAAPAKRRHSYTDPTKSWAHRLNTEEAGVGEENGAPASAAEGGEGQKRTVSRGPFRLATEDRMRTAESRRQAREERLLRVAAEREEKKKEEQRRGLQAFRRTSAAGPMPKGLDAILEEGRRKRQEFERWERTKALEEQTHCTFRPTISKFAAEKRPAPQNSIATAATADGPNPPPQGPLSNTDIDTFLAASKEWEEKRQHNLRLAQRRLEEAEEERRRQRFVNSESDRIVQQARATDGGHDVFGRLVSEVGRREEAQKRLEEKYTPSFQPDIPHRSPTRSRSLTAQVSPARQTDAVADDGTGISGHDGTDHAASEHAPEKGSLSFFEDLYDRSVKQRAKVEAELERLRGEEAEALDHFGTSTKRTRAEIDQYVALMEEREAERRAKLERAVELEQEAASAAATARAGGTGATEGGATPGARSAHVEKMARRGRERWERREQQKRQAEEEARLRKEKEAAEAKERRTRAAAAANRARTNAPQVPGSVGEHGARAEARRAKRMEALRQQLVEREMAECTFKPRVCAASEEMASRSRFPYAEATSAHLSRSTSIGGPQAVYSAYGHIIAEDGHPDANLARMSLSGSNSHGPRSASTPANGSPGQVESSPPPRLPRYQQGGGFGSNSYHAGAAAVAAGEPDSYVSGGKVRSTESLTQELENLEKVLNQWRELEQEL